MSVPVHFRCATKMLVIILDLTVTVSIVWGKSCIIEVRIVVAIVILKCKTNYGQNINLMKFILFAVFTDTPLHARTHTRTHARKETGTLKRLRM